MKKFAVILAFMVVSVCSFGQSAHLKGRSVVGPLPYPDYDFKKSGTVVVDIWVDNYGNVAKAQAGAEGTTLTNARVLSAARNAALKTHFNQKADAPALQQGTITFTIILDGRHGDGIIRQNVEFLDSPTLEEEVDEKALKFLGIPVDGSREGVIAQLKEKGFDGSVWSEYLEGQFNGDPVKVFIHTYHDKVDRIIVEFDDVPEMDSREQYDHLLSLLKTNEKYKFVSEQRSDDIPLDSRAVIPGVGEFKACFSYSDPTLEEVTGEVWLTFFNNNRVCLYYDNLKNRPRGEDL